MSDRIVPVADGFWNLRGTHRVAGVFDVGTQASLVRRTNGRFVLLDAYTLSGPLRDAIYALTDGGAAVDAILNVHPFHTLHVRAMYADFPKARLYGTARHPSQAPELPWEPLRTEDPALHSLFADDFTFTVPRGVDFVPADPALHFASVLVLHRASATLHVDDTLMYSRFPLVGGVTLHPSLPNVLQKRPGAVAEFRAWGADLVDLCRDVRHLCTAHIGPMLPAGEAVAEHVEKAFARVEGTLRAHEDRYG